MQCSQGAKSEGDSRDTERRGEERRARINMCESEREREETREKEVGRWREISYNQIKVSTAK